MKNLLKFVAALLLLASSAHAQSTWNGNANDGIWGTSGNWLGGTPGANTDAIIPAGLVGKPYPTVDFSANCRTLTIQGGSLTINSDADLTINLSTAGVTALSNSGLLTVNGLLAVSGNVVNNGTIVGGPVTATNPNDGLVQFDNTATATLSGTGTTSLTNVTFSATSNMVFATNNKVNIGRIVRLRGRNWATGDKVLLTSSASTTGTSGMVDDAQAGSTITGNISVERAINGSFNSNDGYRHYSTPVRQPKFSDMAVTGVAPAAFTPRINSTYAYPATTNLVVQQLNFTGNG